MTTQPRSTPTRDDAAAPAPAPRAQDIFAIDRPDRRLRQYYLIESLLLGPFFLFLLVPRLFRFNTMRYAFDEEGVSMRWGVLFRREINLAYARIQDIHLKSNVVERWLGLARIDIQTASGSHKAEMTIEGIRGYEALREFLYQRMRGIRDDRDDANESAPATTGAAADSQAIVQALDVVAEELRALRAAIERRRDA